MNVMLNQSLYNIEVFDPKSGENIIYVEFNGISVLMGISRCKCKRIKICKDSGIDTYLVPGPSGVTVDTDGRLYVDATRK